MLKRLLSAIGWLGTVLVFGAVAVRLAHPDWNQQAYWAALAGLILVVVYLLSQWREFIRLFRRRQARYGSLAATSVLAVLGILVAVNYIAVKQDHRWDLTVNKQFSLSTQTRQVLDKLTAPLQMLVFTQEPQFQQFHDSLDPYAYASKQVSVQYIDADKQPLLTKKYGVESYGTIVMLYQGRTARTTSDTEQDLTNTLLKVITGRKPKIYFTSGHGEKDTADTGRTGYSGIEAAMAKENETSAKLVLAQQGSVPDDATVVVVAGPTTDFFPQEIDALKKYLAGGGKLLLLLDPPAKADNPPLTNLLALAHEWDMQVGDNVVVDVSGMGRLIGTDASVPVAASYPSNPITEHFNLLTAFPLARSVTPITGGVDSHFAQSFIQTSPRSWAETDIKSLLNGGQVKFNADQGDKQGPISIACEVSAPVSGADAGKAATPGAPKPETRVVVVGDSDFPSNAALGIQGNRDMFMNIVDWLSQQEDLISIRPRPAGDRRVTLTAAEQVNITWLVLLIIPGFIIGSGVYTWWRRR
ncbi:MAG TPA: Gldg family protein [Vicinamibacterales bacterium]|nr:Gldg family protein [Vicinamibacterales bacterium]